MRATIIYDEKTIKFIQRICAVMKVCAPKQAVSMDS